MIKRLLAWIRAQFTEARPPAPYIWPQSERPDNDRILLEQHQLALMEQIDQPLDHVLAGVVALDGAHLGGPDGDDAAHPLMLPLA